MNPTMRAWTEIIFNLAYLLILLFLILAMLRRRKFLEPKDRQVGNLFITAFILLGIGDLGHVGLRALAFLQGQAIAEAQPGDTSMLVGIGSISTGVMVTLFYIVMAIIWRRRFKKPYGWFGILIILAGFVRLVMLALPQNQWSLIIPPQPWSLYRNIPLIIQGLGVAFLMLRDAIQTNDRLFRWVGISILLSFAFYLPVILFVQQQPLVGLLMIPKTIAYLAIAALAYNLLFRATIPRRAKA